MARSGWTVIHQDRRQGRKRFMAAGAKPCTTCPSSGCARRWGRAPAAGFGTCWARGAPAGCPGFKGPVPLPVLMAGQQSAVASGHCQSFHRDIAMNIPVRTFAACGPSYPCNAAPRKCAAC
jgi:hypothetical protein